MVEMGSDKNEENETQSHAHVLGIRIDRLDMDGTLNHIEELIASRQPHQHVVVNAAKVVAMRKDERLTDIVSACDLVSADGQSIIWASRILGDPLPERVAGIDLMMALLRRADEKRYRVFFFGAEEAVVRRVVHICREQHPGLQISGWRNGYFSVGEEEEIVEEIRASKSDILFVGMSSPKKEYWLARYIDKLSVPFCMGVGGSFDVLAGKVRRAPQWMQQGGLEWLFRFLQEPGRMWKRYLSTNSLFAWLVLRAYVGRKLHVSG